MPNMLQIPVGETRPEYLRVYFSLAPISTAEGSQPQISINGSGFTTTGISTLTHVASGQYYAGLDSDVIEIPGDIIVPIILYSGTIYSSDTVQVVETTTNNAHNAALVGSTGINMSAQINKFNRFAFFVPPNRLA